MLSAPDLLHLSDSLWLWQVYDPAVKADLFATAVKNGETLFVIDPVPLAPAAMADLLSAPLERAVLLTNANHLRAAAEFAERLGATILAAPEAITESEATRKRAISDGEKLDPGVTAIALDGAAPGEMAFHFAEHDGTLVLGDALINLEPYGFALLPPKYCADQKTMRRSLRRLLDFSFARLLFAHGTPILSSARSRLEALLS